MTPGEVLSAAQCARRRWLESREKSRSTASRAASRNARSIRAALQAGVDRATDGWQDRRVAVADATVTALGVTVRADLLEPLPDGGWGLRRFRASTRRKPWHVDDLALQTLVLRAAGVAVRQVELWRLDRRQRRDEVLDVHRLMRRDDRTLEVEQRIPGLQDFLNGLGPLDTDEPDISPGPHCSRPRRCPHVRHCGAGRQNDSVRRLPRGGRLHEALHARGITAWEDIPDDLPLTGLQSRMLRALRTGVPVIDETVAEDLAHDGVMHFLDFEAWAPAIPPSRGLAPYDPVLVQWSLHTLRDGELEHRAFLGDSSDPRAKLAERLLEALGTDGPIVVCGEFEGRALGLLGHFEPGLLEARGRLVDLLPLLRRKYVHPGFHGFSLKQVLPVLCPGQGYDELGLVGGGEAALAYDELVDPATPPERQKELRRDLLAYCAMDTMALVQVREAVLGAVGSEA